MNVTNIASYALIATGWHKLFGFGANVGVPPGGEIEVNGPNIEPTAGGPGQVPILGKIVCQETATDSDGFQVIAGAPLVIRMGDRGIVVRHYSDLLPAGL